MDKQEETAPATVSTEPAETPIPAKRKADLPKNTRTKTAAAEQPKIELPQLVLPAMDLPKLDTPKAEPAMATPAATAPESWRHRALLAASLAFAAVLGAVAGAAATAALTEPAPKPAPATVVAAIDPTLALKETVVRLSSEVATLKASLDAANRSAATQLSRLTERFDRAEKAQTEPAAKLAKIAESLDRLERRVAAAEPTGSVTTVEKQQGKPPVLEGWRLLDFHAGRALIESRAGGIYEVGPGSNLPGLGKVESVKREDGKVVVVTPKGIIASALEPPRRPPGYR